MVFANFKEPENKTKIFVADITINDNNDGLTYL
jgi:hypothetical protein